MLNRGIKILWLLRALCLLLALCFLPFPAELSPARAEVTIIITNPEYAETEGDTDQSGDTGKQDGTEQDQGKTQPGATERPREEEEEKTEVKKDYSVTYTDPETKINHRAEFKQLGTAYSVIILDGKTLTVPTSTLTFAQDVPKKQKMAVVYAPKYGRASMRKGASNKTAMFYTCYTGAVVAVLKTGKSYTKINYHGVVGYLRNTSLQFYAPEKVSKLSAGKLSYNGKTTGKTTVNLRSEPSKKTVIAASFPTGTSVTILGKSSGWYEIETGGYRGYVQAEFLTPEK